LLRHSIVHREACWIWCLRRSTDQKREGETGINDNGRALLEIAKLLNRLQRNN